MRKLKLISGLQELQQKPLSILTAVQQLSSYDMIYIYHHMMVGNELQLVREENHYLDKNAVQVCFKGFKIGYLTERISAIVAPKLERQLPIKAKVTSISKVKYLPFDGLDIEILL